MNRREKEIRTILMGFVRYEGSYCIAADNILKTQFLGLNNGSDAARLRGLKEYRTQYRLQSGRLKDNMPIVNALLAMGIPVFLFSAPDASAILYRHWLLNPVLITFEDNRRDALICFYTAKNLFSGAVIRHCVKKLTARFPENFTVTAITMKPFVSDEEPEKTEKRINFNLKKRRAKTGADIADEEARDDEDIAEDIEEEAEYTGEAEASADAPAQDAKPENAPSAENDGAQ